MAGVYGVDPRAQIALARHAPIGVTLRHYQDFALFDLSAEIRKLPGIKPEATQAIPATGTYDVKPVVRAVVPTGGTLAAPMAPTGTRGRFGGNNRIDVNHCGDASKHVLAPTGTFGATRLV